jgi:hypothetical protein
MERVCIYLFVLFVVFIFYYSVCCFLFTQVLYSFILAMEFIIVVIYMQVNNRPMYEYLRVTSI